MKGRGDAFQDEEKGGTQPGPDASSMTHGAGAPRWSAEAQERLSHVPSFVRGMVKKIYREYAAERGIGEITPALMDRARAELGLEGM